MSQMKETAICPVSFIDNNIVTDKDINGLFMNPYNYKIHSDQYCGAMVSEILKHQENNRNLKSWKYNVQYASERSNFYAIKTYMITNIADLIRNTLIKFMQDVFFDKETLDSATAEGFKSPATHAECIGSMLGGCFESSINIEDEVCNALCCANLFQTIRDNISVQMTYVEVDIKMSSVYSMLVANVFDRFIVEHVNVALTHQSLDQLYTFLYFKCFNEDPKELPSAQL